MRTPQLTSESTSGLPADRTLDPVPDAAAVDDAPTRERVATSILENGPSTAADLAARLSLTPAAVRSAEGQIRQ